MSTYGDPFLRLEQRLISVIEGLAAQTDELKQEIQQLRQAQEETEPLLTTRQVADILQCVPETVYRMRNDGRLKAVRPNRYRRSDVINYCEQLCPHENTHAGHHPDQPHYCEDCGKDL